MSVPVTTVPKPFTVKTRSTGSRAVRSSALAGTERRQLAERGAELGQARARLRGDGDDRAAGQEGPVEEARHVVAHQLEPVGLDHVGLGQRHDAAS